MSEIKHVLFGAGEPMKGIGGFASTSFDGRILVYEDGHIKLCENQSIRLQELKHIFNSDKYKIISQWKFN